ncbi:hypothetical protein LBW47_23425, partial [Ralstonia solanacearum]|nr:hypothetical protein [Ralstonia solanacearum]
IHAGKHESSRVTQDPGGSDLLRRNTERRVRIRSALTIIQHSDAFSRCAAFMFYEAQPLHHD